MILICVGASEYSMERLLRLVDELCSEEIIRGEAVVAQRGESRYHPQYYHSFTIVGRKGFQKLINKAELVITHGGTGCVIPSLRAGKKVIVFPRLEKYKEHLDNHQLELAEYLAANGYALCATNKTELIQALKKVKLFVPERFQSNNGRINELVIDFIDHI